MDELSKLFGGAEQVWQYITQYAVKAGREASRIILESYYVVKSPNTPALDKTIIIAALGYQLLPGDLMSKNKYGWLGFLDNGAALALAYDRVKTRVTPQIEAQVDAVLNQWFGTEHVLLSNDDNSNDMEFYQSAPLLNVNPPIVPNRYNEPIDDEEVIID